MNYAHKRKVFKKRLIDSEVIRSKVSNAERSGAQMELSWSRLRLPVMEL